MFLFKAPAPLHEFLAKQRKNGAVVGFIPTMGALHDGHLSLVRTCKSNGQLAVCSIFVNPTQFNQQSDFSAYPKTIEADLRLLYDAGCDVVFHPDAATMYPEGLEKAHYDFGTVTNSLEGAHRPGHFDGVITIVKKLFDLVQPDHAYFGQKDFQQCAVIQALIRHFNLSLHLHIEPTVREASGLAMSSRNSRLSEEEREKATTIYQALQFVASHLNTLEVEALKQAALAKLDPYLKPEYLEIADRTTLEPLRTITPKSQAVALIAAWCGNTRLIDNLLLGD